MIIDYEHNPLKKLVEDFAVHTRVSTILISVLACLDIVNMMYMPNSLVLWYIDNQLWNLLSEVLFLSFEQGKQSKAFA